MPRSDERQARRSRIQLVLIFVLFLLPPAAAWVAWKMMGESGVSSTSNAGTLVAPARPLAVDGLRRADGSEFLDADLHGRWTYVVFADNDCEERCRQQLYLTRQIRLAMSKDIPRVQRLLVLARQPGPDVAQWLSGEHPDLHWVVRDARAQALLQPFRGDGFAPQGEQFFLVDPLGNLMMYYDPGVQASGVMKDLQKLLKISQIG
jgi:cytochrome oxidase Cu insertion factor (SCO1/SenC/PrrC family)